MNELINIQNRNGELLVSARELHKGLGIGKDFSTWVKDVLKYGFEENVDFTTIWNDPKNGVAVEYNGNTWFLYSKYQDKIGELADYKVSEYGQLLKWTEQGRKFIIELLNKKGE